ncbi:hypothetical protein D187_001967 [Cystobacter fuscus DSM 2262]|uniref:Uncharacterized protein n=1 Tax=Cystobacter fuscus (strain ATCC 25194 / DSM 2262 / NBRC 100088 / M29) TaxID=1242864 RepID=S9P7Q9_CYSF2|nr:hypothetical protein D187_001967 [Cystobacter fuscus DSM 2262]
MRGLVVEADAEARSQGSSVLGARALSTQYSHIQPEILKRSPVPSPLFDDFTSSRLDGGVPFDQNVDGGTGQDAG